MTDPGACWVAVAACAARSAASACCLSVPGMKLVWLVTNGKLAAPDIRWARAAGPLPGGSTAGTAARPAAALAGLDTSAGPAATELLAAWGPPAPESWLRPYPAAASTTAVAGARTRRETRRE